MPVIPRRSSSRGSTASTSRCFPGIETRLAPQNGFLRPGTCIWLLRSDSFPEEPGVQADADRPAATAPPGSGSDRRRVRPSAEGDYPADFRSEDVEAAESVATS